MEEPRIHYCLKFVYFFSFLFHTVFSRFRCPFYIGPKESLLRRTGLLTSVQSSTATSALNLKPSERKFHREREREWTLVVV